MAETRGEADVTKTDGAHTVDVPTDHVIGLQWVAPHERFDPLEDRAIIGRSESCAIRLGGTEVSRQHASLESDGPLWLLRDGSSKNGSWLNAVRVDVAALTLQDILRIGDWVGVVCSLPRISIEQGSLFTTLASGLLLSGATFAAIQTFERFATRDLPIAIYGETGTGKEGIAQAIHHGSGRAGRLVPVNCAAVPEAMAEGLLFGHLKGAFTGAHDSREGHIRAAHRGTLFLDEVAELPLSVQAKLLRVLEEHRVIPLGGTEPVLVDFRLIVACQEPLSQLVGEGSFRRDLYARVSGLELTLPPLRQRRKEVIRLLLEFLAGEQVQVPVLDSRLVEALCAYEWPYNVRELKQLASLFAASGKSRLTLDDLPQRFRAAGLPGPTSPRTAPADASARRLAWLSRHARELDQLRLALEKHDGNLSHAAIEAGVPRHRARRLLAAEAERTGAARK
jgi:transcriptional regulator of acetoin/glycerol metabolism